MRDARRTRQRVLLRHLVQSSLSLTELRVLLAVEELADPTVVSVAGHVHLSMAATSQTLASLRRRDAIRAVKAGDGRQRRHRLTAAGKAELDRVLPLALLDA